MDRINAEKIPGEGGAGWWSVSTLGRVAQVCIMLQAPKLLVLSLDRIGLEEKVLLGLHALRMWNQGGMELLFFFERESPSVA